MTEQEYIDRIAELEECLCKTRLLVSKCSIMGFHYKDAPLEELFLNQANISRLVKVRQEERDELYKFSMENM